MTWVEANVERRVLFEAPLERVFELVSTLDRYLPLNASIARFEKISDARWKLHLQEKKVLGFTFRPEVTVEASDNGVDSSVSRSVGGNVDMSTTWSLQAEGERCRAHYRVKYGLDAMVPSLMVGTLRRYVEGELDGYTDTLIGNMKRVLR